MASESEIHTRDRLLLEAARLFRYHGYAQTTLREIADATGIKAGSIYYHFDSKEDIIAEVLDRGIQMVGEAVRQRVDALPENATSREIIAAAIEGHLWGVLHHGDFSSANIRAYGQAPVAVKSRHRTARRAYSDYWHKLFNDAIVKGDLRKDCNLDIIQMFVLSALNWTVEWYNPQKGSLRVFVGDITKIVFDGVFERR